MQNIVSYATSSVHATATVHKMLTRSTDSLAAVRVATIRSTIQNKSTVSWTAQQRPSVTYSVSSVQQSTQSSCCGADITEHKSSQEEMRCDIGRSKTHAILISNVHTVKSPLNKSTKPQTFVPLTFSMFFLCKSKTNLI